MISHLHVRNFAIIDQLDVDFRSGLNIITGETGAGKSIIIEAVSLALGSRADTAFIRSGQEKATIQLVTDSLPALNDLLEENDIPVEDQLIIKRELSVSGKNTCRVNDTIVSLTFLNKLCRHIADIHGQYDHQALLHPENHIHLLDLYSGAQVSAAKKKVAELFLAYSETRQELNFIKKNEADALRQRDFMQFELNEIEQAALQIGEDDLLNEQLLLLQNSEKIYQNLSSAYAAISEESPAALELLGHAMNLLEQVSSLSNELKEFSGNVADCYYKLEDTAAELRRYRDSLSFSPEELDAAIKRLDIIDSLKRKYGGTVEEILSYAQTISEKLDLLQNTDEHRQQLEQELDRLKKELSAASLELSALRRDAAEKLSEQITSELLELNFNNAHLSVSFQPVPDDPERLFSENGIDTVEFKISTNKGEKEKPLAKVASGGEISRIMLAFKKITGNLDQVPTLIFDEIDSGISGITASIVGKKLKEIAATHQVICITHLPQIAACGSHHYKIQKSSDDASTHTTVVPLSDQEKVGEIARLLGGINITETTLKSAQELLELSQK